MSEAPERIWARGPDIFDGVSVWECRPSERATEYVRADLLAQARREALEEAAREIDCGCAHREKVLSAKGAERWKYCGDPCSALDAAAIRAMKGGK